MVFVVFLGCSTQTVTPIIPGPKGFSAIEFTRVVGLRDHAINTFTFSAKSRLIGDRAVAGGQVLYCGMHHINVDARPFDSCFGFEAPSTLIIGLGGGFKEVRRVLPEGSFRLISIAP